MTCENCDPKLNYPGRLIRVNSKLDTCVVCGDKVNPYLYNGLSVEGNNMLQHGTISKSWDNYFRLICQAVASKSPCLSRKIGAILVRDRSIVSTGYNGPSRGVPHCGGERNLKDDLLITNAISKIRKNIDIPAFAAIELDKTCPRRILGFASGEGMQWCPAQHAEENAISNAARLGVSVLGSTLYMNSVIPCKNCFGTLINSGITEIVIDEVKSYDKHTEYLINNSSIKIRRFEL